MKLLNVLSLGLVGLTLQSCISHHYAENDPAQKEEKATVQSEDSLAKIQKIRMMQMNGLLSKEQADAAISKELGIQPVLTTVTPAPQAVSAPVASALPVQKIAETVEGDQNLPVYKPAMALNVELSSVGSDSMDNMMKFWEQEFKSFHKAMKFSHEGKGSSTAIPALMEGRSNVGPMSRKLKGSEVAKFKAKFGYEPVQFRVAVDTVAVYLHPNNPFAKTGLSLAQIDAIFSSDRKRGHKAVKTWGDLGLTGEWAKAPINVYSRNKASGTYSYFNKKMLLKGKYKTTNKELVGSEQVVEAISNDKFAVGYSGIAYNTPYVSLLPVKEDARSKAYTPNEENAFSGDYYLTRSLYITLNLKPGSAVADLHKEFMKYVYSRQGQEIVRKDGYFPVNSLIAGKELSKIQ